MQERRRSWSVVRAWTSCRVPSSFHVQSVTMEWAATASSAMAVSTGCTRNAVGSSTWQRTPITDVHSARELHALGRHIEVQVGPDKLEVGGTSFCYLGDMLSAAGGCELSTTTRVKTAWKKFNELLPVLSSHHLSFKTLGRVFSSCVQSAMLHAISAMSSHQTLSPSGPMSYLHRLTLRIWTSFWMREGSASMDMWNTPMMHTSWWKVLAWEA